MSYRSFLLEYEQGVSLLEILVVVAVTAVLVLFSVPFIRGANDPYTKLRSTAFDISGRLSEAKIRSVSQQTPYRLEFNTGTSGRGWRVRRGGFGTTPTVVLDTMLNSGITFGIHPNAESAGGQEQCGGASGICMPQQATTIAFNTRGIPVNPVSGAPNPSNGVYITDGRNYLAVTVSLAGTVQVWRYDPGTDAWLFQ
jgi:Tfp pilus assembly protein FimT